METRRLGDFPYIQIGILAGLLGAFVVAVFFLILDIAAGRPFATPTALGATLFRSETFDLSRAPELVLIAGFSAVHGTVFIAFASIAAVLLLSVGDRLKPASLRLAVLVGVIFVALTATFFIFSAVAEISALDGWRVLSANLLAALAMGVPLSKVQPAREIPAPEDAVHDAGHPLPT